MAADMMKKAIRFTGNVVRPEMHSDKTVIESVKDFFSDVVPQAYSSYSGSSRSDDRENIEWVTFQNADINDFNNPDFDSKNRAILLVIGYNNGVQIWCITSGGDAQEVLSLRQGPITCLKVLQSPETRNLCADIYRNNRPLVGVSDSPSNGGVNAGSSVRFISLRSGEEMLSLPFKPLSVVDIECNKRFLVITFPEKLVIFDNGSFKQIAWISNCYPSTGLNPNPICLGTRWLAYADRKLISVQQSYGGMCGDGSQSYAATVISAAKTFTKGLTLFGESVVNSVTGVKPSYSKKPDPPHQIDSNCQPGIVTVIDVCSLHSEEPPTTHDSAVVAHFHAHANEPVASMAFDVSGVLLVTACKLGHNFHVFYLMPHPVCSSLGAVHHLYTLHRGDTSAKVIDISFTLDSRWVAVSTHRGTTHVYPISTYGGPASVRTHTQPCVVNRASQFHKSAGLEEIDFVGKYSPPSLSSSPGSQGHWDTHQASTRHYTMHNNMCNPRLPPYPHSTLVYPLAQIKQPLFSNTTSATNNPGTSIAVPGSTLKVAAIFSAPRCRLYPTSTIAVDNDGKRVIDSLFIMSQSGLLIEYSLEPRPSCPSDKASDHSGLVLHVTGRNQWHLHRTKTCADVSPPLSINNPLILASQAVFTQSPTQYSDHEEYSKVVRDESKESLLSDKDEEHDERWVSQVEIITHLGPHRRLWMGPQFTFKKYQTQGQQTPTLHAHSSLHSYQQTDSPTPSLDLSSDDHCSSPNYQGPVRSNPVAMPSTRPAYRRYSSDQNDSLSKVTQLSPLLIEACSLEQSPNMLDFHGAWNDSGSRVDEEIADAMIESPLFDGGPESIYSEKVDMSDDS